MKYAYASLAVAGLAAIGLSGCVTPQQVVAMVNAVAANAPQTCADLQQITGNVSTYAGQVQAANVSDPKVSAIVNKINSGKALADSDCAKLSGYAPTLAKAIADGVSVFSALK